MSYCILNKTFTHTTGRLAVCAIVVRASVSMFNIWYHYQRVCLSRVNDTLHPGSNAEVRDAHCVFTVQTWFSVLLSRCNTGKCVVSNTTLHYGTVFQVCHSTRPPKPTCQRSQMSWGCNRLSSLSSCSKKRVRPCLSLLPVIQHAWASSTKTLCSS